MNKLKVEENNPFFPFFTCFFELSKEFIWKLTLTFWLYFHYFSSGWRTKKFKYLQKLKKNISYLYFLFRRRPECFLLLSKQILFLEDFSPSVIKLFMLKQYENIQSVMMCRPPSCSASSSLWSIVVEIKFSGWVSPCLLLCEASEFPQGLAQLYYNAACAVLETFLGLFSFLTFYMVCGCKYQSSYATSLFIAQAFPSPY